MILLMYFTLKLENRTSCKRMKFSKATNVVTYKNENNDCSPSAPLCRFGIPAAIAAVVALTILAVLLGLHFTGVKKNDIYIYIYI